MLEDELRTLVRSLRDTAARRTWQCPKEATIAAYVDRRLSAGEKKRVEAHLADCSYCVQQIGFLMRLQEDTPFHPERTAEILARARRLVRKPDSGRVRPWGWVVTPVAASVLAASILFFWHPGSQSPPEGQLLTEPTGSPGARAERSPEAPDPGPRILDPVAGALVSPDRLMVRWQEVSDAVFYRILLVSSQGDPVWEGQSESDRFEVRPDVRLEPGGKYFVWVYAHLRQGKTVKSKATGFTVKAAERE